MKPKLPRFTLGSLFLVVLAIATGIAWWLDHTRLKRDLVSTQTRLEASELLLGERVITTFSQYGVSARGGPAANRQPFGTPSEFITALRDTRDYYEFQNRMVEFVNTPVADDVVPSLVRLLEQGDAEVRSRALLTMSYLTRHAKTLVPVIVPLLDDEDQNVRWYAANVLGLFGREARLALPSLQRIIKVESSQISAFAAGVAFKIDATTEVESPLQEFLRHGDAVTRWRAVEALGNILPHKTLEKETEEALLEAFRLSEDESLKLLVAQLLERIRQGPVDGARPPDNVVTSNGTETRAELTEAPRWK